ncbi:hypothetical protein G7Z17_g3889 [Cylindrodendrum hubeiense]|uniref:Pectinesterase n=1 Tax=Cylindrodendrum hubeiense TaxID=595255 RepID=A0A9P5HEX0_9HYPO|nr:hypothetical protein G7Z17_g3889 [Cylindrodendrum hubeiense]
MFTSLLLVSSLIVGVFGAARTTPPSGAIVVAASGGDFITIQEAVNSISSSNAIIFVQPGTYEEQVLIPKTVGALTIYGYTEDDQDYSKNQVILTHSLGADVAGSNDASGTLRAKNDGLKVYNINVANSRGKGVQAIALSAYGSQQGYYGCQFTGYQDTILSSEGYHYFHGSYIEGATDFIFGQKAIAWFDTCTIGISGSGYITASGRDSAANPSWYVINQSTVKALSGVGEGVTYLGRPWRTYARVVFQNSELGSVVNPAGWKAWGTNPTDNVYYGEYGNTGDGATGERASFAQELTSPVSIGDILGSTSWLDSAYISGTTSSDKSTTPISFRRLSNSAVFESAVDVIATPSSGVLLATTLNGTPDGFAYLKGGTIGGSGGEVVIMSKKHDNCTNIWIDHVHLECDGDGLIDSRKDTTLLTTSYGHYARGGTEMRLENCYFENVNNPITMDDTAKLAASGNVFEGTSGDTAKNSGDDFDPADFYEYTRRC